MALRNTPGAVGRQCFGGLVAKTLMDVRPETECWYYSVVRSRWCGGLALPSRKQDRLTGLRKVSSHRSRACGWVWHRRSVSQVALSMVLLRDRTLGTKLDELKEEESTSIDNVCSGDSILVRSYKPTESELLLAGFLIDGSSSGLKSATVRICADERTGSRAHSQDDNSAARRLTRSLRTF